MKPTKFFSIFLSVVAVLGLLAGCAAPQAPTEKPAANAETQAPAAEAAPTESGAPLQAAEKVTDITVWSFIQQHLDFFQKMAVIWNKDHPDEQINIVPTYIAWSDIHDKLLTAMQAGQGVPDVADIEISKWSNFMKGDIQLLDLNKYEEPYKAELVSQIMDVFSKDGHLYGAPSHLGATVMYYNTDLLDQAGVDYKSINTWADFENAMRAYKEKTGKYMTYCETYGAYQFTVLLGEQGKDLVDAQGMPQLTTPEAMKAVDELKKWKDEDLCGSIPSGNADTPEGKAAVASGDVAALMYPLWYMSRFTDEMSDLAGKIAIAPLPVWDDNSYKSMGLGGTGTTVYKDSPNADLAARFITWAKLSEQGSATLWTDIGFDPINTKVYQNLEVTKDPGNKFLQYFETNPFDVLSQVKDKMFTIKTMQNSGKINDYLSANTWNQIITNGEDPVQVMDQTQQELMSQSEKQ